MPEGGVSDDGEGAKGSVFELDIDDGVDIDLCIQVVHVGGDLGSFETSHPEEYVDHVAPGVIDLSSSGQGF